ncbi:MAG TPA: serine/threonine-protein kinase, partial [Ktedonobacteraceae bacterium]|nr:serine/threonine-protein kinase [Ktedonobacteraceae bacterium]
MTSNSNNLTGKMLGTCRIDKLIGQGGMGAVYLAQQIRPARYVAVKVLLPNLTADSQVYKEFLARFQREADVIARLEHVNIMPIYEYGEQDSITYLVMPYLPGGSLRDKLAQQPVPTLRDTVNYISQAASALDYAHAQHVIHRDLKPANFLLHNDGRLVLADFGIARLMQESNNTAVSTLTSTGMMLGTPEYMAPEMFTGNLVDYRSDIYALGIILYQLLSGQVPFRGNTFYSIANSHLQDAPPSIHVAHPALPVEIDEIIQTALAKKPENRFKSAGALAQALRNTFSLTPETDMRSLPTIITASPSAPVVDTVRVANPKTDPTKVMPEPLREGLTPVSFAQPVTPPVRPYIEMRSRQQPLLLFIGILLVIVLIVGGVLIGLQINKSNTGTGTTGTTTTISPVTHSTTATTPSNATATPTKQTLSPTIPPATTIPKGAPLYSATSPGAASNTNIPCDNGGEQWADFNSPIIQCQGTSTMISNAHNSSPNLVGTLLTALPGGQFTTSNYVIEVQLQQIASSNADFGVYFRNQPGNQQGVYTFLIHSDGTWSAYVYNNTTAARTEIAQGNLGDAHAAVTIDVVANGS